MRQVMESRNAKTSAATLSGLMRLLLVSPRVARSSQPWAERCNPFGIERRGLAPQKVSGIGFPICATPNWSDFVNGPALRPARDKTLLLFVRREAKLCERFA